MPAQRAVEPDGIAGTNEVPAGGEGSYLLPREDGECTSPLATRAPP